jgi:ATP-binding cassette, subfamily B, bacterial PglK
MSSKRIKLFNLLGHILPLLDTRERLMSLGFLVAMALGAALETLGVGLIVPFVQLVNDPGAIETNSRLKSIYGFLGFADPKAFFIAAAASLLGIYIVKNIYFITLFHFQNEFLSQKKVILAQRLIRFYLRSPYTFHLQKNSAELHRNINYIGRMIDGIWIPLMVFITELMVAGCIIGFLVVMQPAITIVAILALGLSGVAFYGVVRSRIEKWAQEQSVQNFQMTKWVNQAFGGVKEIKILGNEDYFVDSYIEHYGQNAFLTRRLHTIGQLPRLFIEILVVAAVVLSVIYILMAGKSTVQYLPILALFAVAAFRLMPSMNRMLAAAIMMREGVTVTEVISKSIREINDPQPSSQFKGTSAVSFNEKIQLAGVTFQYQGTKELALNDVSLTIYKGQSVGFVGHSGAGKSTIVDIILGLLDPIKGKILVDGKDISKNLVEWRKLAGYVPQQIFLIDDTVRRNIVFGVPDEQINENRVQEVVKLAQLDSLIFALPQGLNTTVGERGVRLSGGERQRIGIARALYHDPEILILDEATSSLDNETERSISQAIDNLKGIKTILIIAHRLSTVAKCDKLFFLEGGKLTAVGTYKELVSSNKDFMRLAQNRQGDFPTPIG